MAVSRMNNLAKEKIPFFFLIDFEMLKPLVIPLDGLNDHEIFFDFQGFTNKKQSSQKNRVVNLKKYPIPFSAYEPDFNRIKAHLTRGDSYLINLTYQTPIELDSSLRDVFRLANAPYRLLFKNDFVCFSPESFIKIKDGVISTYPMKGTINASQPRALEKIIHDKKELAEHVTVVDLLRNDLSKVAEGVTVPKFRFPTFIKSNHGKLIQLSSLVQGHLKQGYEECLGDVIFSLLPAGSVSGAPKTRTTDIIKAVERGDRGYYSGVAGVFDGHSLDSFVLIRFVERIDGKYFFRSGGGITANSSAESEYQEMIDKIYVPIA